MKKTFTINLSGTVYHIDEDAYNLLDNYLENLKHYFRKEEGADEIIDDIERRISELCSEKLSSDKNVINIVDIENIIAQIGSPEQMDCEEDNASSHAINEENSTTNKTKKNRRLFRNPDDKILGGVASGLSLYFGVDVTTVRLLLLLLLVLGCGTLVPVYIICWILIPEATTAAEKLSMRGEAVTVENIGKTVTNTFDKVACDVNDYMKSDKPRTHLQKVGDVLMGIFTVVLKICMILFVVIFSPVLFALAIALVVLIFACVMVMLEGGASLLEFGINLPTNPLSAIALAISGVFVVGIPLAIMLWLAFAWLLKWKISVAPKWTLLILWIVSMGCFLITLAHQGYSLCTMYSSVNDLPGLIYLPHL